VIRCRINHVVITKSRNLDLIDIQNFKILLLKLQGTANIFEVSIQ